MLKVRMRVTTTRSLVAKMMTWVSNKTLLQTAMQMVKRTLKMSRMLLAKRMQMQKRIAMVALALQTATDVQIQKQRSLNAQPSMIPPLCRRNAVHRLPRQQNALEVPFYCQEGR